MLCYAFHVRGTLRALQPYGFMFIVEQALVRIYVCTFPAIFSQYTAS
jgi:hypothetical protein